MTYWFDPMVGGGGGNGIIGGIPNQAPAMSSAQINASMGWNPAAQAQTTNLYGPGGFGGQTAYYAGLGAAYGRQVAPSSPAAVAASNAARGISAPDPWAGSGFDPVQYLHDNPDVAGATGGDLAKAYEHAKTYGVPEGRGGTEMLNPLDSYQGSGYDAFDPSIYQGAAQKNVGGGYGGGASAPAPDFDFRWGDTPNVSGRPFQDVYEDWFSGVTGNQGARGKVGGWEGSYLEHNPDVLAAAQASGSGLNAFAREHAANYGRAEGRELFDPVKYLQQNPDVAAAGASAYDHYNQFGRKEGREATYGNIFDPNTYLMNNQDVQQAGMDPRTHWLMYGQKEGRQGGGVVTNTRDEIANILAGRELKYGQPSANPSYFDPSTFMPQGPGAGGWQDLYGLGGRYAAAGGGAGGGSLTPQQLINQGNAVNMPSGQFGGPSPQTFGSPGSGYLGAQGSLVQDPFGGYVNPRDLDAGGSFPADYQPRFTAYGNAFGQ